MSKEYVIVPKEDYVDTCNAIREKINSTALLKSDEMAQAVRDIESNKEEQEKSVDITENGTTEILPDENKALSKVTVNVDIQSGSELLTNKQGRIYVKNPVIAEGVTTLADCAFDNCELDTVGLPSTLKVIGARAFSYTNLVEVDFSVCANLETIGENAFYSCTSLIKVDLALNHKLSQISVKVFTYNANLTTVKLPKNLKMINNGAFVGCRNLKTINLPSSLTSLGWSPFYDCGALKDVILEEGFNANNLDLSPSTKYSRETIVSWFEALADRTGLETYTLTIGATNLEKLTEEDIAIATNKNWTIA